MIAPLQKPSGKKNTTSTRSRSLRADDHSGNPELFVFKKLSTFASLNDAS
jgi:hypothetical protein